MNETTGRVNMWKIWHRIEMHGYVGIPDLPKGKEEVEVLHVTQSYT